MSVPKFTTKRAKIPKNYTKNRVRIKEYKKGAPSYTVKGTTTKIQEWRLRNDAFGNVTQNLQFPVKSIKELGAGANLGPMGDLPDKIIFEISLSPLGYDLLYNVKFMPKRFNRTNIITHLQNIIYLPVFQLLNKDMKLRTPRDTDVLMNALLKSLTKNWSNNNLTTITRTQPFRLSIGTIGVPYASVVNKMPEDWIVHPGSHGKYGKTANQKQRATHSQKTGKLLFDPLAKENFFEYYTRIGRTLAKKQYEIFINDVIVPILQQSIKNPLTGRNTSTYQVLKDLGVSVGPNVGLAARQLFKARFK